MSLEFPDIWYHGSNELFEKFEKSKIGSNFSKTSVGFYFTTIRKPPPFSSSAKEYAEDLVIRKGGKPYIYHCKLDLTDAMIVDAKGWYNANAYIDLNRNDILRWLKYESKEAFVAFEDMGDGYGLDAICLILNPDLIEIIEVESL